ncbi:hypothetical protein CL621_00290 [archaeon]|nr:hypothetical protein [archaeon]|tara:strand:- start:2788 stop:3393 length:606 start_codon:yes stop_codon:yes gene_type:complete
MEQNDPLFQENVRNSFKKVKEHINELENEIKELKELISIKNKEIITLNEERRPFLRDNEEISENKPVLEESSIGNKGVYSFIHSFTKQSLVKQLTSIDDLMTKFQQLPRQELLVFLTLQHLENELKHPITYFDISKPLKLSEGCIRTYISNLIKKGFPILKNRINNRIIALSVDKNFKNLNLKQKLEDIYYGLDQNQTKLF